MKLQPYSHQVTGHSCLLMTEDETTICKVMSSNELEFYLNMDCSLRPYVPEFQGIVDVTVFNEKDGIYEFEAHFKDEYPSVIDMYKFVPKKNNILSQNADRGPDTFKPFTPIRYSGLDPKNFHKLPGFQSNEHTVDKECPQTFVTTVGWNPWVQRIQRTGKHKEFLGNKIPYILLENLCGLFEKPCILDLKIGTRMEGWLSKMTTTSTMSFRLTGLQVYRDGAYICRDKFYGRGLSESGLKATIKMFFTRKNKLRTQILDKIIGKLRTIRSVVSLLDDHRLHGCSMVILYEGVETAQEGDDSHMIEEPDVINDDELKTDVRVVDFGRSYVLDAHGLENEMHEDGFVFGLTNLLKMLEEIRHGVQ